MSESTEVLSGGESGQAEGAPKARRRTGSGLSSMVLSELQAVAGQLGITGSSKMRKSDIIAAIQERQGGNGASDAPAKSAPARRSAATAPAAEQVTLPGTAEVAAAEPSDNGDNSRPPRAEGGRQRGRGRGDRAARTESNGSDESREQNREQAPREQNRDRGDGQRNEGQRNEGQRNEGRSEGPRDGNRDRDGNRNDGNRNDGNRNDGNRNDGNREQGNRERNDSPRDRNDNNRDRNDGPRDRNDNNRDRNRGDRDRGPRNDGPRNDGPDLGPTRDEDGLVAGSGRRGRRREREFGRNDRDRGGRNAGRGRERFNPGGNEAEPVIHEDDVLVPVAGILDVLDSYAFVRTSGYLPGPNDVYVSLAQVRRHNLRKGDAVTGAVKQPRDGERKDKFNALVRLDTVNGIAADQNRNRIDFGKLTPLYPQDRLRLETEGDLTTRMIDLIAPIGKGQRGLIVSPPKAGKTMVLQAIANAITRNNPECHLMVVLVDERPEEVTDMTRSVKGEVIASTFDRPAEDHTIVAELAIERAKRLVELGHDVVILLDSITRLGRAYNLAAPASGRILSGGVDSTALYPPKRFFGAARNIEGGGSLTILATALVETGSKMDEVIFEEFKGTGNMELKLDRRFADKRIFPAIDIDPSGTRKEEILMAPDELQLVWRLRRVLHALDSFQAIELMLGKLKETKSNAEFLLQIQKTTFGGE